MEIPLTLFFEPLRPFDTRFLCGSVGSKKMLQKEDWIHTDIQRSSTEDRTSIEARMYDISHLQWEVCMPGFAVLSAISMSNNSRYLMFDKTI